MFAVDLTHALQGHSGAPGAQGGHRPSPPSPLPRLCHLPSSVGPRLATSTRATPTSDGSGGRLSMAVVASPSDLQSTGFNVCKGPGTSPALAGGLRDGDDADISGKWVDL